MYSHHCLQNLIIGHLAQLSTALHVLPSACMRCACVCTPVVITTSKRPSQVTEAAKRCVAAFRSQRSRPGVLFVHMRPNLVHSNARASSSAHLTDDCSCTCLEVRPVPVLSGQLLMTWIQIPPCSVSFAAQATHMCMASRSHKAR